MSGVIETGTYTPPGEDKPGVFIRAEDAARFAEAFGDPIPADAVEVERRRELRAWFWELLGSCAASAAMVVMDGVCCCCLGDCWSPACGSDELMPCSHCDGSGKPQAKGEGNILGDNCTCPRPGTVIGSTEAEGLPAPAWPEKSR